MNSEDLKLAGTFGFNAAACRAHGEEVLADDFDKAAATITRLVGEVGDKDRREIVSRRAYNALSLRVGELEEGLKALYEAMIRYEVEVDGDAPSSHIAMMNQASRLLSEGVSSATIDPVKVEAATPLAGQAEKYLALPSDEDLIGALNDSAEGSGPTRAALCRQAATALSLRAWPQERLRRLVDTVWQTAKGDQSVPATWWADRMIASVLALSAPPLKGGEGETNLSTILGSALNDALSRPKPSDTARLDWLEKHVVNVREPLVHGSRDLFWSNPDESIEGEEGPSDIRAKIDRALEEQS